ncbi:MAG: response regulator [Candidatus Sumerlaeota bacterium]
MNILIVEDSFVSRTVLQHMLEPYGDIHVAVNGKEAVEAVQVAIEAEKPYDLLCLDIMMPEMDGQQALEEIRKIEAARGIAGLDCCKILMTTALSDAKNIMKAFRNQADGYLTKPYEAEKVKEELVKLELMK